ncbi:MAG: Na/Pi symporter [Myxococcota bacterium]
MDDEPLQTQSASPLRLAKGRGFRILGWWVIVAVLLVASMWGDGESTPKASETTSAPTQRADGKLRITSIKPAEAYAGSTVVVHHSHLSEAERATVRIEIAKESAEILHRGPEQLVARVPTEMSPGQAKVRLFQGDRRSKPKDIRVKPRRIRRLLRNLVGGLALLIFGLRTLARGLRGQAGHPARATIGGWTRGIARGLGFGALLGGIGQSIVSAVAFVLGLLKTRLLNFRRALFVLMGAHIGAGVAIVVLPLGISRESLWLVAAGTLIVTLSRRGRGESLGMAVLGVGLVLHGLGIVRSGFEPFVGDPDVLPYLGALRESGMTGGLTRMLAGTVLGVLLQAPGAIFGLVLGIGESTALLGPRQALELLAASNIGMSLGTVVLALPFGRRARRLAVAHVGLAVALTLVFLVLAGVALEFSGLVLGTDPNELAYGKKVLVPNLAAHLAVSYVMAQGLAVVLVLPLVRPLAVFLQRTIPDRRPTATDEGQDSKTLASDALQQALASNRETLGSALAALRAGQRAPFVAGERAISEVRTQLKDSVAELVASGSESEQTEACVTVIRMQQALEQLLALGTRGLEKDYRLGDEAIEAFTVLHVLVVGSISAIQGELEGTQPLDIESARAREIETNTNEAELREKLLASLPDNRGHERDVLWWIEVIGAYEALGNHLYRLAESLSDPADDF